MTSLRPAPKPFPWLVVLLALLVGPGAAGDGCGCGPVVLDDDDSATDDDSGDDDSADDDDTVDDDSADDDDDTGEPESYAPLPVCEWGVLVRFDSYFIQPPAADSDEYLPPGPNVLDAVLGSFQALMAGDGDGALTALVDSGYLLCKGEDDELGLALWQPEALGTGRSVFAWRALDARPLVVGAPHPYYEAGTMAEAVLLFDELDARALIVSGTDRCANTGYSYCDGQATRCDAELAPFRESDMAHVVDSVYHRVHEQLYDDHPDDWVISLHGMDDDGISLSDGTTLASAGALPVAMFGVALMSEFSEELVTSCNNWPGAQVDERACGTYNIQGRLVNGSPDPCAQEAANSTGQFLHLEQSTTIRAQPERVLDALETVLP